MAYNPTQEDLLGMPTIGRAVTATLFVSPNGNGTDGSSWARAYTTLQAALTAASTDVNECTLILLAIKTGPSDWYNIDTTGDPTWSGNYIIKGTHRTWQKIKNDHGSATSVMNFTGYVSLEDINVNLGTSNNGVSITKGAFRLSHVQFVGESLTTNVKTALSIVGASVLKHGKLDDVEFRGEHEFMTALSLDNCCCSYFEGIRIRDCLTGIKIANANSIDNLFYNVDIDSCDATVAVEGTDGIGIDINAGTDNHFVNVLLHNNTINVDDEIGGHIFINIVGEFPIYVLPIDDVDTGVSVSVDEDAWGGDTELIAANAIDKPFKVIGYTLQPSADENMRIRFSADSGTTHFAENLASTKKNKATGAGDATDFIFNANARISASAYGGTAGKTIKVWLEIQEI